jgi:hypothetical protein
MLVDDQQRKGRPYRHMPGGNGYLIDGGTVRLQSSVGLWGTVDG